MQMANINNEYDIGAAFQAVEDELIASMIRNMRRHKLEEIEENKQWSMWQAEQLKASSEAGELTEGKVYTVLVRKEKENVNVTISAKKISNYFPKEYSKEQIEDVIYTLLEEWKQKEGGTKDAGITV